MSAQLHSRKFLNDQEYKEALQQSKKLLIEIASTISAIDHNVIKGSEQLVNLVEPMLYAFRKGTVAVSLIILLVQYIDDMEETLFGEVTQLINETGATYKGVQK